MKKLRILGIILALLLLFMTACGAPENTVETTRGNETAAQPTQGAIATVPHTETEPANDETQTPVDESAAPTEEATTEPVDDEIDDRLPVYGEYYYDLTNVILYLEVYGELPDNYITKAEARKLGWEGGSVEKYREGAAIGGDYFGNYEGLLPAQSGRSYTECDIDTNGYSSRGSRRLIFSSDGLYFYTSDHYESFTEYVVTDDYEVIEVRE